MAKLLGDWSVTISVQVNPEHTELLQPIEFNAIDIYDGEQSHAVTDEELDEMIYPDAEITIYNDETKIRTLFHNDNGFTARRMLANVLEFENESRQHTNWFGGIDAHHIFFEGLHWSPEDDAYIIFWGS